MGLERARDSKREGEREREEGEQSRKTRIEKEEKRGGIKAKSGKR